MRFSIVKSSPGVVGCYIYVWTIPNFPFSWFPPSNGWGKISCMCVSASCSYNTGPSEQELSRFVLKWFPDDPHIVSKVILKLDFKVMYSI